MFRAEEDRGDAMKWEKRQLYLRLSEINIAWPGDWGKTYYSPSSLCSYCKFAWWKGCHCKEMELVCEHPIARIAEDSFDVWAGGDCWAFCQRYKLDDIVEFISHRMQGELADWPVSIKSICGTQVS